MKVSPTIVSFVDGVGETHEKFSLGMTGLTKDEVSKSPAISSELNDLERNVLMKLWFELKPFGLRLFYQDLL